MIRVAALVPAAGSGVRLGRGPKAFVRLGDATLLEHAVAALRGAVDEVVVAVPAGAAAQARELVGRDVRVIEGAESRQATVRLLVTATRAETVLVHDAARPFLPRAALERVLAAAQETGAATAALRVHDTIVYVADGTPLPREGLRVIQTPQGFARELLVRAHESAAAAGVEATDDAALVRRLGVGVELVEGSPLLHKLTTPDDLKLGLALLELWRAERAVGS
ncbi:MAG: 2-C-methyl-D-erythritol 4-phosphate cytidylyltransferase [Trueperaceae bacterium]